MRFFRIPFIVFAVTIATLSINACKETPSDYEREKVYLDSLSTKLKAIDVALNVDEKELQNRIALVNTWYVDLKDTSYDVAKKMQIDFNGFKVVYKKYIDNFFSYSVERDVLKEQYTQLEKQAKEQTINRTDFKAKHKELSQNINKVYVGATAIAQPVYELEFSWKRYYKIKE